MNYTIKKEGAMYVVYSLSGVVQFRSMKRANCTDWINEIAGQNKKE